MVPNVHNRTTPSSISMIFLIFFRSQALNLNLTRARFTLSASSFFINENKIKHWPRAAMKLKREKKNSGLISFLAPRTNWIFWLKYFFNYLKCWSWQKKGSVTVPFHSDLADKSNHYFRARGRDSHIEKTRVLVSFDTSLQSVPQRSEKSFKLRPRNRIFSPLRGSFSDGHPRSFNMRVPPGFRASRYFRMDD